MQVIAHSHFEVEPVDATALVMLEQKQFASLALVKRYILDVHQIQFESVLLTQVNVPNLIKQLVLLQTGLQAP